MLCNYSTNSWSILPYVSDLVPPDYSNVLSVCFTASLREAISQTGMDQTTFLITLEFPIPADNGTRPLNKFNSSNPLQFSPFTVKASMASLTRIAKVLQNLFNSEITPVIYTTRPTGQVSLNSDTDRQQNILKKY